MFHFHLRVSGLARPLLSSHERLLCFFGETIHVHSWSPMRMLRSPRRSPLVFPARYIYSSGPDRVVCHGCVWRGRRGTGCRLPWRRLCLGMENCGISEMEGLWKAVSAFGF